MHSLSEEPDLQIICLGSVKAKALTAALRDFAPHSSFTNSIFFHLFLVFII